MELRPFFLPMKKNTPLKIATSGQESLLGFGKCSFEPFSASSGLKTRPSASQASGLIPSSLLVQGGSPSLPRLDASPCPGAQERAQQHDNRTQSIDTKRLFLTNPRFQTRCAVLSKRPWPALPEPRGSGFLLFSRSAVTRPQAAPAPRRVRREML